MKTLTLLLMSSRDKFSVSSEINRSQEIVAVTFGDKLGAAQDWLRIFGSANANLSLIEHPNSHLSTVHNEPQIMSKAHRDEYSEMSNPCSEVAAGSADKSFTIVSFICIGVLIMLLSVATTWWSVIAIVVGIGLFEGGYVPLQGKIATQLCGVQGVAQAFGFMCGLSAIPHSTGSRTTACRLLNTVIFMFQATGSYYVSFLICGSTPVIGGLLMTAIHFVRSKEVVDKPANQVLNSSSYLQPELLPGLRGLDPESPEHGGQHGLLLQQSVFLTCNTRQQHQGRDLSFQRPPPVPPQPWPAAQRDEYGEMSNPCSEVAAGSSDKRSTMIHNFTSSKFLPTGLRRINTRAFPKTGRVGGPGRRLILRTKSERCERPQLHHSTSKTTTNAATSVNIAISSVQASMEKLYLYR
ncbi:hypothetical protein B566_EDAN005094 [Ephemera danica]|nr:hypothetical protein B566_EDAN005094 [Ephemera danica]